MIDYKPTEGDAAVPEGVGDGLDGGGEGGVIAATAGVAAQVQREEEPRPRRTEPCREEGRVEHLVGQQRRMKKGK